MEQIYFELLKQEDVRKYKAFIKYILVTCPTCGKSWGIVLDPEKQRIDESMLTCRRCNHK